MENTVKTSPTPVLKTVEVLYKDANGAEQIGSAKYAEYQKAKRERGKKLRVYTRKGGGSTPSMIETDNIIRLIPQVGMGASYGAGSDSYPATIVKVSENQKTVWTTDDESTATKDSDYYTSQNFTYKSRLHLPEKHWDCYTLRKNGRWIRKGNPISHYWQGIGLDVRRKYQDPCF